MHELGIRNGIWRGDTGSFFNLSLTDRGMVEGTFCSQHGQPDKDAHFPVTGFINGPLIGLVVSWGTHKSITSWAGMYEVIDVREGIHTAWHLVREYADRGHTQKNEYWEAVLNYTGSYYYIGENM